MFIGFHYYYHIGSFAPCSLLFIVHVPVVENSAFIVVRPSRLIAAFGLSSLCWVLRGEFSPTLPRDMACVVFAWEALSLQAGLVRLS